MAPMLTRSATSCVSRQGVLPSCSLRHHVSSSRANPEPVHSSSCGSLGHVASPLLHRWSAAPRITGCSLPSSSPLMARAGEPNNNNPPQEFGYSRKDILLIGGGLIALGYAMYYGLQAAGLDAGIAGNWVQMLIFLGICVGWVGSYIYRVGTKQMTYVKQLEQYEEAVMQKRIDEMTDAELQDMLADAETDKDKATARRNAKQ